MKKFFSYAMSLVMMTAVSFSTTGCGSDDVEDALNKVNDILDIIALFTNGTDDIKGTAWYNGDLEKGNIEVLAFYADGQARYYLYQNGEPAGAQYVGYSYDSSNNVLTIGGKAYTVTAFTAGSSLVLNIDGTDYQYLLYDINALPTVEAFNNQDDETQPTLVKISTLAQTQWLVGSADGTIYLYEFADSGIGVLYNFSSDGQTLNAQYKFTWTFNADTQALSINIERLGQQQFTVLGYDQTNGQLYLQDAEGQQYVFTYYSEDDEED